LINILSKIRDYGVLINDVIIRADIGDIIHFKDASELIDEWFPFKQ